MNKVEQFPPAKFSVLYVNGTSALPKEVVFVTVQVTIKGEVPKRACLQGDSHIADVVVDAKGTAKRSLAITHGIPSEAYARATKFLRTSSY